MLSQRTVKTAITLALMCSVGTITQASAYEIDYPISDNNKMVTSYNNLGESLNVDEETRHLYMKSLDKIDESGFSIKAYDGLKFNLNYREDGQLDNISADISDGEVDWIFTKSNGDSLVLRKNSLLLGDIWSIYRTNGKVNIELRKATDRTDIYNSYEYNSIRKNRDRELKETFGWTYDNYRNSWSYVSAADNLRIKDRWFKIDGTWYNFDSNCEMRTDWVESTGGWYYLDPIDGKLCKGWRKINNKWYYLNKVTGVMETGWKFDNNSWYYLGEDGAMVKSTEIDGIHINEYGVAQI